MAHATEQSVLGDFSGATFTYYGAQSRFFREGGKFLVETDGPDGKLSIFEIKYTFGVYPLQQYLIEFPGGRLQALSIAWDSRPEDQGGQRWFHLYPSENIRYDDILHWTKLNQNWNFMCAECHSTGVQKNYDATNDRFATTWAEISVGCEACHGQGSAHVAWAREKQNWWPSGKREDPAKGLVVRFDERHDVAWTIDSVTGNATRAVTPPTLRKEVETCGLCHAAVAPSRKIGFPDSGYPTPTLSLHLAAGSTMPTDRCSMKSITMDHSSRARCSRPVLPAATATSRMTPQCVSLATMSACNVTRPINMRLQRIIAMRAQAHRSVVRPATCPYTPTWSSIAATITVFASRGRTTRKSLGHRTPATTAMPTKRRNGRRKPLNSGMVPPRKAFSTMPKRSTPHGRTKPMLSPFFLRWRPIAIPRLSPARTNLRRVYRRRTSIWPGQALAILTQWCGSAPSTCSKTCPLRKSGPWCRRTSLIPAAACASGPPPCSPRFQRLASLPPTAKRSSTPRASSSLPSVLIPIGPKPARRSEIFTRAAHSIWMPKPSIKPRCGSRPSLHLRRSRRSLSTAWAGRRRRKRLALGDREGTQ
jgi:hypothetical protein